MKAFFLFSSLLLIFSTAKAVPLGDQEAFLANSGVALAQGVGGVLYNPANLAVLDRSRVSASGNTFYYVKSKSNSSDFGNTNTLDTAPSFLVSANKSKDYVTAFSIIVPFQKESTNGGQIPVTYDDASGAQGNADVSISTREAELDLGFSFAKNLNDRWAWGLTLLAVRSTIRNEVQLFYENESAGRVVSADVRTEKVFYNLTTLLGLLYQDLNNKHRMTYGLMISPPSVALAGESEVVENFITNASGTLEASLVHEDHSARRLTPWKISLGASGYFRPHIKLIADLDYQPALEYTDTSWDSTSSEQRLPEKVEAGGGVIWDYTPEIEVKLGARGNLNNLPHYNERGAIKPDRSFRRKGQGSIGVHLIRPNYETGLGFSYEEILERKYESSTQGSLDSKVSTLSFLISGAYKF